MLTDPSVKPILDQQSILINKLLKNAKIDDVEPLKVHDDHSIKDLLYEKFAEYRAPSMSSKVYNQYAQAVQSDIRARHLAKQEHYRRLGQPFIDSTLEDLKSFKNPIIQQDGASYGFDFLQNQYFKEPLENVNEIIDLQAYEGDIRYYSDTSNLNLAGSLQCLLQRAESKGLSITLLKRLLHKFGTRFIPDLRANLDSQVQKDHCFPIFSCLVEYIDIPREKNLIKMARLKITRKQGEDIQITVDKLKHIIYQQVQIQNPNLSEAMIKEATERLVVNDLKHFVTEAAFKQLEERTKVKVGLGASPDLQEFVRDLKDLENSQPELRPRAALMAPGLDEGSLAVALASSESTKVNQVSSFGYDKKQQRGRFDRSKSPNGRFERGKSPSKYERGRSPTSRRFDKGYNNEKRFDKTKQDRYKSPRGGRMSRSPSRFRDKSSSRFRDSGRRKSPFSPRRTSSFSPRRSSSPYRQSRSQNYNQTGPREYRRRSYSDNRRDEARRGRDGSRTGSRSNSNSRHQSPTSYSYRKDSSNKYQYCTACGSTSHYTRSCFRYPANNQVTEPCSSCLKRGRKLYHQSQYCRFKESKYVSPFRSDKKPKN